MKKTQSMSREQGTKLEILPSTSRGERVRFRMKLAKKGFTLIELLVVIAIIGILAAIILPVYSQAKKSAYRSADMSNMNQLRTALGIYKVDQGAYPPALLGYVNPYDGGAFPAATDIVPANQIQGALFPKRVSSLNTFTPALDRPGGSIDTLFVNPVWPNGNVGTAVGDQRYGPSTTVEHCDFTQNPAALIPSLYYQVSGYDVANVKSSAGARNEIHYTNFWSVSTVASTCDPIDANGDPNDSTRQLGYTDPPDSTVVTWDSFFRDYDASGNPFHQKQDLVLFLGGDARPYDSATIAANSWQVMP